MKVCWICVLLAGSVTALVLPAATAATTATTTTPGGSTVVTGVLKTVGGSTGLAVTESCDECISRSIDGLEYRLLRTSLVALGAARTTVGAASSGSGGGGLLLVVLLGGGGVLDNLTGGLGRLGLLRRVVA